MKTVNLLGPTVIEGAVRYPTEGPFMLLDDVADHLVTEGRAELLSEDEEDDPLDVMKVTELKQLATAEAIDLGEAKSKVQIIAAIRAARAAKTEE